MIYLCELFDVEICKNPISKSYAEDNPGTTPYVTTTSDNNGVECFVDYPPQYLENTITVSKDGASCDAFLQPAPFCGNEKVMVLLPKQELTVKQKLFYCCVISFNKYKFMYGRKCSVGRLQELLIPAVDEIPSWAYDKNITAVSTTVAGKKNSIKLEVEQWKEFLLKDLFFCQMGNGIDASATSTDEPVYNYVSRDSKGNGVVGFVDKYYITDKKGDLIEVEPFEPGTMTLALGGSYLGSCFVQTEPYYTAQNVAVLKEKEPLSIKVKLFLSTLIRNECKYKYVAFGRELNTHYKTDFSIKLPIQRDDEGNPIIDEEKKYSEDGYIPDWRFMEDYIKSLPYSDKI